MKVAALALWTSQATGVGGLVSSLSAASGVVSPRVVHHRFPTPCRACETHDGGLKGARSWRTEGQRGLGHEAILPARSSGHETWASVLQATASERKHSLATPTPSLTDGCAAVGVCVCPDGRDGAAGVENDVCVGVGVGVGVSVGGKAGAGWLRAATLATLRGCALLLRRAGTPTGVVVVVGSGGHLECVVVSCALMAALHGQASGAAMLLTAPHQTH